MNDRRMRTDKRPPAIKPWVSPTVLHRQELAARPMKGRLTADLERRLAKSRKRAP